MVFLKEKSISGKKYFYLTKSIRLPGSGVKTIQKLVKKGESREKFATWFEGQEIKIICDWAAKAYRKDSVFTEGKIRKIEEIRLNYKKILKKLSKNQLKDLFDRFTANFTYESNAIEGNSLTLKDVAIVLFEKNVIKGKELREIYETVNSRKVVDKILQKKFRVTEAGMVRMHRLLVKNMDIPAGYKKVPNYAIGRAVETVLPERVDAEMKKLIHYFEENEKTIHPLQLAAKFHGKLEKIHPFEDGNGRVGRFMINVILVDKGYPPLIIRKTQRIAYFKCLEDFDNGYAENLERFILEKYEDTFRKFFEIYLKYLK